MQVKLSAQGGCCVTNMNVASDSLKKLDSGNAESRKASGWRRAWRRFRPFAKPLIVILVLGGGLLAVSMSPLRAYLMHAENVRAAMERLGGWATAVYVAGASVLIAFGFPRYVCLPIAGLAFGFWKGLLWTQMATVLGYYATFIFVRWGGRGFIEKHFPRLQKMHRVFHEHAVPTIILIRLAPVSGIVVNLLLGLSPITHGDFFWGTLLGTLPEAVLMTYVGSSAAHLLRAESVAWVAGGLFFLILVWLVFSWLVRRSRAFDAVEKEYVEESGTGNSGEPL